MSADGKGKYVLYFRMGKACHHWTLSTEEEARDVLAQAEKLGAYNGFVIAADKPIARDILRIHEKFEGRVVARHAR